jgi:hypothetical protein
MNVRTLAALSYTSLLYLGACGHSMPPAQAIGSLQSPDPTTRQTAADALRTPQGVPPEAIHPLMTAASSEQDPHAKGAMLITLGKSGSPEAKAMIDQAVATASDPDMRRWASRALKYWMLTTGQIPADYKFPDDWPYGQPGFPPPLAK